MEINNFNGNIFIKKHHRIRIKPSEWVDVCLKFFIRISTCTKYKIKYFMIPPLRST